MKFTFVAVLAGLGFAAAACPNDCSGHGVCGSAQCECYRNWVGADCSDRVCTFGRAFIDSPTGDLNGDGAHDPHRAFSPNENVEVHGISNVVGGRSELYDHRYGYARDNRTHDWDEGHFYRECSNKGTCDRATGECQCFPGFEGAGCTRQVCPDDCSGHGQCLGAEHLNSDYVAWDLTHTQKCVCDPGYTGPSCSLRKCPAGVDPIANVYTNTDSIWKIEFNEWESDMFDATASQYLPSGPVHWTMTYTDEMGDEWTTSAVTSYYQTLCAATDDTTDPAAACRASPFHSDPREAGLADVRDGADVGTNLYADASFTFSDTFIAEQVNASIAALPTDAVRDAYVWVTHVPDDEDYLIYPSYGIPDPAFTAVDDCSNPIEACKYADAFSAGASLAVNDAEYRFPYFVDLDNVNPLNSTDITNCGLGSMCVFIRLKTAAGSQSMAVSYKYKSEIRSASTLVGEYSESTGHSGDGTIVEVSEVGTSRFWSVNTDGTPRIDYDSNQQLHACSRRGLCDYESGLCECFSGYSGVTCSQRSILGY